MDNYDEKYFQVENNMFIRLIYKIYNAYKNPKYEEYSTFFRRHMSVNTELYKQLGDADQLIKELRDHQEIDFWLLYDFGSFIKLMEKIFMVKNDIDSKICCDSMLEDKISRVLIFNISDDVVVKVTASLQDQGLSFEITRNFGKQMRNSYKITSGDEKFKLFSDKMTLQRIIEDIGMMMADYLYDVIWRYVLNRYSGGLSFGLLQSDYYIFAKDHYSYDFVRQYKDIQYLIKHKIIQI